ncbi:MAG: SUMF1/EgtB/PvdO family nonheme iron enzyme [Hymenobacter sp.]|nr:SUMF1/EgtB/PvdO family nonheme iron enzyme [Hymenobacter sp.]
MVRLSGGTIEMRDDRIKRSWTVEVPPFLLAQFPVTQEFYLAITQQSPSTFTGATHPVETVSWRDAVTFCNLLSADAGLPPYYDENGAGEIVFDGAADGYRLPSEAEWEYACKAGTKEIRYGELAQIAWYKDNSGGSTQPVGLKAPNAWGLYDMLGNVWEWCSDMYDEQVYGSYRILRGGGWFDEARSCLATNRRRSHPMALKIDDLGFRVARRMNTI